MNRFVSFSPNEYYSGVSLRDTWRDEKGMGGGLNLADRSYAEQLEILRACILSRAGKAWPFSKVIKPSLAVEAVAWVKFTGR